MSSPLSEALHQPVTSEAQIEIIRALWPGSSAISDRESCDWGAYFKFYTRECSTGLGDECRHLCARTHEDISKLAQLLRNEPSRKAIRLKLRQSFTPHPAFDDEGNLMDGSIKIATRLFAMINVGALPYEISGQLSIPWSDGSLENAVHDYFNDPPDGDMENIIFGSELTARNIDRVAKIGIVWTDNLADHLRLVERDKKVCVFHHASFLKHMEQIQSPTFPSGFAKETLDTLSLLFPSTDRKTKHWLEGELRADSVVSKVDLGLLRVGSIKAGHSSRRLENYRFWRDRLGALRDAIDEATPPSKALLKALSDRKQGDRWLNSWVATVAISLTLFFGLVQSIEGAFQVYKAYHPVVI